MDEKQRRNVYRIEYFNAADRPQMSWNNRKFEIKELSEEAIQIEVSGWDSAFRPGESVAGSVQFPGGESFIVTGEILRVSGSDLVIRFKKNFPLRKIMAEQRRLIQKYKVA